MRPGVSSLRERDVEKTDYRKSNFGRIQSTLPKQEMTGEKQEIDIEVLYRYVLTVLDW